MCNSGRLKSAISSFVLWLLVLVYWIFAFYHYLNQCGPDPYSAPEYLLGGCVGFITGLLMQALFCLGCLIYRLVVWFRSNRVG